MLINNLLYANPNTSSNPVCVLKLLISSCSSFQSQKCFNSSLHFMKAVSCTQGQPSASNLSQLQSLCCCQASISQASKKKNLMFSMSNECQARVEAAQKVFLNFSNRKMDLAAQLSKGTKFGYLILVDFSVS